MNVQNKLTELKDICDKAFKRNSIYPLMEIPKPDSKGTVGSVVVPIKFYDMIIVKSIL